MFETTLSRLKCPSLSPEPCGGALKPVSTEAVDLPLTREIRSGHLECLSCGGKFPILAGVAILVDDVGLYLLNHVKGISKIVSDSDIPDEFREEYLEAKAELEASATEHIEEDLEADRVNALYLMTHYLRAKPALDSPPGSHWWRPLSGEGSPLIDSLVEQHWDSGPFAWIERWMKTRAAAFGPCETIELGCGVGGLYPLLKNHVKSYLGVDSSFASIALARRFALGAPYSAEIGFPEDLLHGPVSRKIEIPAPRPEDWPKDSSEDSRAHCADFIVSDLDYAPLPPAQWDVSIALNMLDMLDDPSALPRLQHSLLRPGGSAIQSSPYIWHEVVARQLRAALPPGAARDSAQAAAWLYEEAGFELEENVPHLPWLFFKHVRQLEIYSVNLFSAKKSG